jgi:hypothetical protein
MTTGEGKKVINIMETKMTNFYKPKGGYNEITIYKSDEQLSNKVFSTNQIENDSIEFNTNEICYTDLEKLNEENMEYVDKSEVYFICTRCGYVIATESNYCC